MMQDIELLELAAKAAGIELLCGQFNKGEFAGFWILRAGNALEYLWNPLTDNGDALRLAVKLGLILDCVSFSAMDGRKSGSGADDWYSADELLGNNDSGNESAMRRAIVRAAAAIGKAMP